MLEKIKRHNEDDEKINALAKDCDTLEKEIEHNVNEILELMSIINNDIIKSIEDADEKEPTEA